MVGHVQKYSILDSAGLRATGSKTWDGFSAKKTVDQGKTKKGRLQGF
jgi:hypothetical protein